MMTVPVRMTPKEDLVMTAEVTTATHKVKVKLQTINGVNNPFDSALDKYL